MEVFSSPEQGDPELIEFLIQQNISYFCDLSHPSSYRQEPEAAAKAQDRETPEEKAFPQGKSPAHPCQAPTSPPGKVKTQQERVWAKIWDIYKAEQSWASLPGSRMEPGMRDLVPGCG